MIYEYVENGRRTMRGDRWHLLAWRVGRCFVRRVPFNETTHPLFGLAWYEHRRCCVVTAIVPLNWLLRAGYACWLFAKYPPPATTTREAIERAEAEAAMWRARATGPRGPYDRESMVRG